MSTPSATPTPTPTATNLGPFPTMAQTQIAFFAGNDPTTALAVAGPGSSLTLTSTGGSLMPDALWCQGTLASGSDAALALSYTAGPQTLSGYGVGLDGIVFRVNAAGLPGQQLKVTVSTLQGNYSAVVNVPTLGAWGALSVAVPDAANPYGWPVLSADPPNPLSPPWSSASMAILSVDIAPVQAGAFDFIVEQVLWLFGGLPTTTISPTNSPSAAPSFTITPSPTLTPTPLPVITTTAIASFEGSDLVLPSPVSGGGGTLVIDVTPGCPYGTAGSACHCTGSCTGLNSASANFNYTAGANNAAAVESSTRTLTFHVLATALPGQQLLVSVVTTQGVYSVQVTVPATGVWTDVTVAMPDDQAPGDLPQLTPDPLNPSPVPWAQAIQSVVGFTIQPVTAGAFDFAVDDIRWGSASTGASPSQVATALGASLADVQEAYSLGLDEYATWVLIVLARHCGCHPHTVLALRSTLSWGQIAVAEGTTWTAVLAEVDADMAAASIVPGDSQPDQFLNSLINGPPSTAPLPSVTPYVPDGPLVLQPAGGC